VVSEVKTDMKKVEFWKTMGHVLNLSRHYYSFFETVDNMEVNYYWIYYFNPNKSLDEAVRNGNQKFEKLDLQFGFIKKATEIEKMAPLIDLLLIDNTCYTSLSLLVSSFQLHSCSIKCELGLTQKKTCPSHEPELWEHGWYIQNMEAAIVQSCRCVEAILGEPPKSKKLKKVIDYKERLKRVININPDDEFKKANRSYLDFYYFLIDSLRNPSAHSFGNIHFDLKRKNTIEAQCFAALILNSYIEKHTKEINEASKQLFFNQELLIRVSKDMTTYRTE
jgi:hypothetical protein